MVKQTSKPQERKNSPDSLQAKFQNALNFLDDEDVFFSQIAEQSGRKKAKTDYKRRDSNVSEA